MMIMKEGWSEERSFSCCETAIRMVSIVEWPSLTVTAIVTYTSNKNDIMIHIDIIIPERFSYKENRPLLIDIIKDTGDWLSELRNETNLGELYDLEIRLRDVELYT